MSVGCSSYSYELAHIPGGWTWRAQGDVHHDGFHTPWSHELCLSREEALEAMRSHVEGRFRNHLSFFSSHSGPYRDTKKLLHHLEGGLWGFIEPELGK